MSMRELHIWIPSNRVYDNGRPKAMDGLNEIIRDNRAHRNKGARIERENVEWCAWYIHQAMRLQGWEPMADKFHASPVSIAITFYETNNMRDIPNIIGGGLKYVLDALSRPRGGKGGAAAIYDDSRKWIDSLVTAVEVAPDNPGIRILVVRQ